MSARLALLALALCACGRAGAPDRPRDSILIASVRAFGPAAVVGEDGFVDETGSGHIARRAAGLLDDIAAATDVLGPARFEIVAGAAARPEALAAALAARRDVRALILLHGDLSAMRGIDPALPPHETAEVVSRRVDHDARRAGLERVAAAARAAGARLLLATAPLGRQARVEVPELGAIAEELRGQTEILDLAAHFEEREPALLFENGLDRLDAYGHDELARALFDAFMQDPGLLPPRDETERAARREARALHSYLVDEPETFVGRAAQALRGTPTGPRSATRRAALRTVLDGLDELTPVWAAIEAAPGEDVPGLAVGRSLARLEPSPPSSRSSGDAFERALMDVVALVAAGDPTATEAAGALVDAWPHRLDAWIVLQFASRTSAHPRDLRDEALANLRLFPRSAVPEALTVRVLQAWPETVAHLPALLLAQRPYTEMLPTNPMFETARRRAWLGYREVAAELLDQLMDGVRAPPSWHALRETLPPR